MDNLDNRELKDSQINLILNNPGEDDDSIDLGRVFHNMKELRRVFAWVMILCIVVGLCVPLILYQINKDPLTVFSAVTLSYQIDNDEKVLERDPEAPARIDVSDLTAPDGEELDLNQITSSYVLQNALNGVTLSQPITLTMLRSNIQISRIMTEDSARQQEILAAMIENKSNDAYEQMANTKYTYTNTFVVSLTNGFSEEDSDSRNKLELKDDELRLLLDRILIAYNDYLVETYNDIKLPDDMMSVIDVDELDIPESVDQLRVALTNLSSYIEGKPEEVRSYRSWQTGRTLNDLEAEIQMIMETEVEYLSSYVYANGIAVDRDSVISSYQYRLMVANAELDEINDNIASVDTILSTYKNDEILVSSPDSDKAQTVQTNTEYYNNLIVQQTENQQKAADKTAEIVELETRIAALEKAKTATTDEQILEVEEELDEIMLVCQDINDRIRSHMEEIFDSAFYKTLAEHSGSLGKQESFLEASAKKMIIGVVAGAVIGFAIWFIAGLVPEFSRRHETEEKTDSNQNDQEVEA